MARISRLLSLLLLLFAFDIKLKGAVAVVVDTDGGPVRNGGEYYLLPGFEGEGGGVTLAANALAVVHSASKSSLGLPVIISVNDTMVIDTDAMVAIDFSNTPSHANSSTWMVALDESAKMWYVGIGSAEDHPSHKIKMGSFKFKDYNLGYKFVFCGATNTSDCQDIGIYTDADGNYRLALHGDGEADTLKFKNADK